MLASLACAPRRLACRCWAGRVALRENRARQHLLAAPRGSEVLARAGCRAGLGQHPRGVVSFPYAPRTGGAYDSHHQTAGIADRAGRRSGVMAARGARAAMAKTRVGRPLFGCEKPGAIWECRFRFGNRRGSMMNSVERDGRCRPGLPPPLLFAPVILVT